MRPSKTLLAAMTAAMATAMAGGSSARAESGVHIDPQSPAGVEYAVPLHSGRRPARPNGRGGSQSGSSRLFGAGISPPAGSLSARSGSRSSDVAVRRGRRGAGSAARARPGTRTDSRSAGGRSSVPVSAAAGYSPTASLAALIAVILLAGGGLGLLARRRGRLG